MEGGNDIALSCLSMVFEGVILHRDWTHNCKSLKDFHSIIMAYPRGSIHKRGVEERCYRKFCDLCHDAAPYPGWDMKDRSKPCVVAGAGASPHGPAHTKLPPEKESGVVQATFPEESSASQQNKAISSYERRLSVFTPL